MKSYRGLGTSEGVAIARGLVIDSAFSKFPRIDIETEEKVQEEISRLLKAQDITEKQIKNDENKASDLLSDDLRQIFTSYRLFIRDKRLVPTVVDRIIELKINAEWALVHVISELEEQFKSIPDPYLRGRFDDIRQISERLMGNLRNRDQIDLSSLNSPVILVCHELSPADALNMPLKMIQGIVSELGGETSHASILARAWGVPCVVGIDTIVSENPDNKELIIDGSTGEVIITPSKEKKEEKLKKKAQIDSFQERLKDMIVPKCKLADGRKVKIAANLDFIGELKLVQSMNIDSIGLIRTEFLYYNETTPPDEENQYQLFKHIIEENQYKPVTIRTWDMGADKTAQFITTPLDEANPALGLRAIRMCLRNDQLFRTQIRAILRASLISEVRLMIPMVTNVDEMIATRTVIEEEKRNLKIGKSQLEIGCMIETPAAALIVDELLEICDFISIGSNDLVQYTLAIDRANEHVANYYTPFHPAILRLLEKLVIHANQLKKPISICGEMAADPFMQMFLLGVGEITFSMSPNRVLMSKQILKQVDSSTCKKMAFRMLSKHTLEETNIYLKELRNKYLKDLAF